MLVQAQPDMGEGSPMPSAPQHTPPIIQPPTSKPQKKQKPEKPMRQDTELPQTSVPTETIADEPVNEEMYDSLEKASTIAISFDAEQDRGNINTMRDSIAQTRSENVSKQSNDPPLLRVNTLVSGEDLLKLKELMKLCTKLSDRVLNLETTKTAQAKEIANLKKRVKRLERNRKSRSHVLKRLYKMFDTNVLNDEEVVVEDVNAAIIATTVTAAATTAVSIDDSTLAQALMEIKTSRPKARGIIMKEPSETPTTTTILISSKVLDKGKGIMVEEPLKMKKKAQISLDEELAFKLQAEEDEQERITEEKAQEIKDKILAWDNVQAMIYVDYELAARLQEEEQGELTIEEKSILFVKLIDKRKKHFAKLKVEEKRRKHLTKAQKRSQMCIYLKNMARFTHVTPSEPVDSLSMGDEHLNTILATELDEFIKSCVENLVPNPSQSEGENECDMLAGFTTFYNVLFNANYDFDSGDDQSFSDEDLPKKIYSNPLFDEKINLMKIDQHPFNAESDLIESMPNHDSSITISSKIDSLFDEFAGELILLKSIPLGIDDTDCHHEKETRFVNRMLYDNSSPRPPKEIVFDSSNADIKSFSPSPIPNEDSDSRMEEIDLSLNSDDPMPPGVEDDDYDSGRDIPILEELLDNYSLSLHENESYHFDIPSPYSPPAKPPDGKT
nr:hypothetical protein [Tanacetum cinerariifolium]